MRDLAAQRPQCCQPRDLPVAVPLSARPAPGSCLAVQTKNAQARRRCSAAVSNVDKVNAPEARISWSSRPVECLRTVEQPSKEAEVLEETFWHHPVMEVPATRDEAMVMMERLHQETGSQALSDGINVVAFTGGNGPPLTAYLLNNLFDGNVVGCIGNVQRLPQQHVEHSRYIADLLGIELVEVDEQTWGRFDVPKGLRSDADEVCTNLSSTSCEQAGMALFSGATADDLAAFSRGGGHMRGLRAPLANLSRAAVNSLSKIVGLPLFEQQA